MKILGIDSSGLVASVAMACDDVIVAEFTVNNKQTHSQTLLPMLEQVMRFSGVELEGIDGIAVAAGPGSFTGLRIGASTAKGLGLALDKPIISVPTIEGMAYQMAEAEGIICPIMDARRNQVYTGIYEMKGQELHVLHEQFAVDIHELLQELQQYNKKVHFLGDGVPVYRNIIETGYKGEFSFAPAHMSRQRAASIAVLGQKYFEEGRVESAAAHKPVYLRKSQAERERMEREHAN